VGAGGKAGIGVEGGGLPKKSGNATVKCLRHLQRRRTSPLFVGLGFEKHREEMPPVRSWGAGGGGSIWEVSLRKQRRRGKLPTLCGKCPHNDGILRLEEF
jgi:hypothetical protein